MNGAELRRRGRRLIIPANECGGIRMTRPTMRTLLASAGLALLLSTPAMAQLEGADLEAEAALLGETGLLEKAPKEAVEQVDPDEKLLEKVGATRTKVEQKINTIQQAVSRFPDLDEGLNELNMGMLKGIEGYNEAHNDALEQYQAAHEKGDKKAKKKLAKTIKKLRKAFIKRLEKLNGKADKLVDEAKKLEAKVAEQEAEEAAEAAAAEGAEGAEDGDDEGGDDDEE